MKKIYGIGDVHFSSMNKWNIEAGEHFLKWFEDWDPGKKEDCELFFAGDLSEKDVNPGIVVLQLTKLFNLCEKKFSHTWICMGNHEKKYFRGEEQHSLMFTNEYKSISVVEEISHIKTPNGFSVLVMPFFKNTMDKNLYKYYNNLEESYYNNHYDAIVGHWEIDGTVPFANETNSVNVDKLKSKSWFIGHIHTRVDDRYLGSVWPNNSKENESPLPRGIKVLNENREKDFIEFPTFLEYKHINIGDDIEKDESKAVIYIVDNFDMNKAKELYSGFHITPGRKKTEVVINKDVGNDYIKADMSYKEMFSKMVGDMGLKLTRPVYGKVMKILGEEA